MWSSKNCDRKLKSKNCPITSGVLNGRYPQDRLKNMSNSSLSKLVERLIHLTEDKSSATGAKNEKMPKWWPQELPINFALNREEDDDGRILRRLVFFCSKFFKSYPKIGSRETGGKDKQEISMKLPVRRPPLPQPFVLLDSKQHFMKYLKLDSKQKWRNSLSNSSLRPHISTNTNKLSSHPTIPFSSDLGKIMLKNNNQLITEDMKLKRIEKTEWYTNKTTTSSPLINFEAVGTGSKSPTHYRRYKMPKRQFAQKRLNFHSAEFLQQFCVPLKVNVKRENLIELQKRQKKLRVLLKKNNIKAYKKIPKKGNLKVMLVNLAFDKA